jgi:PAS domain S-box-containing protein
MMNFTAAVAEAVLATPADAIVASDAEGVVRYWNPGAERIFGYAGAEALGRSLDIIIPERLRQRHWAGYRRVMQGSESRYGHGDLLAVPAIIKDGGTISVEFTIVPLRDPDRGLVGIAAIMRDVTARFEETRALKRQLAQAGRAGSAGQPTIK